MNKFQNTVRKILMFALALTLCLGACSPAMASIGDRTLLRVNVSDGDWSRYIQNVFATEDGIYVLFQEGNDITVMRWTDVKAEPETFVLKDFFSSDNEAVTGGDSETGEDDQAYSRTLGWIAYEGDVYALQYRDIYRNDTHDIEGGWLRRLVLKDGEATLEDSDFPQLDWTNMIEDYGNDRNTRWPYRMFASGERFYCVCYTDSGEEVIEAFDLATGFTEEISLDQYPQVYPSTDGAALITRYEWTDTEGKLIVSIMDLDSQSEQRIGEISMTNSSVQGMCYDKAGNRLIYSIDGQIMVAPGLDMTQAESVNDSPPDYDMQMELLPDGFVLMWNQTTVAVRNTDPAQRSNISLNIQDSTGAENFESTIYDFTNARGDVSVALRRTDGDSSVLQAMMNRDAGVDIYCLTYQSSALDALRNRGFLTDLSGNTEISAAYERMYPYLQKALMQDGKISMIPVSLYGWQIGYDPKAWEKVGLTEADLPHTWDEFFDLLETLPAKTEGTEYQPFTYGETISGLRYSVMTQLMDQYQAYLNRGDREYAFNTPVLKGLFDRLDAVNYEALNLRENYDDESYYEEDNYRESVLSLSTGVVMQSWADSFQPLPLSVTAGEDPILPVTLGVAFVNPYSEHPEEAMAFLAAALKNSSTVSQYNYYTDLTEPVRYADYEERKESMQQYLDECKANLETAEEDAREEWENTIKSIEEYLTTYDETEWMISPKAITDYKTRTSWIEALSYDFASSMVSSDTGVNEYWDLAWQFAEQQVSSDDLLSTIDKKVQMMRMEGN